jgi:hypothetical protein
MRMKERPLIGVMVNVNSAEIQRVLRMRLDKMVRLIRLIRLNADLECQNVKSDI